MLTVEEYIVVMIAFKNRYLEPCTRMKIIAEESRIPLQRVIIILDIVKALGCIYEGKCGLEMSDLWYKSYVKYYDVENND